MGIRCSSVVPVVGVLLLVPAVWGASDTSEDIGSSSIPLLPPMGWSTWNSFKADINATLIREAADALVETGLDKAGYNYVLIDDCWPKCDEWNSTNGHCVKPAPRDAQGRIQVNATKFPEGMKAVADYVHSKGLKFGIYTAVGEVTCAGFTASKDYEHIDVQMFAEWGVDFVKHDWCNYDCSIHDGCLQKHATAMSEAIKQSGRDMVYYLDAGNSQSLPRLYNPHNHLVDAKEMRKISTSLPELVWSWAKDLGGGHVGVMMWKTWRDLGDSWEHFMDNLQHSSTISMQMAQTPGAFNMPDMLTVGQGGMTTAEYRSQVFLFAVLSAPFILGADIRGMTDQDVALLTNPEILAVNQDPDCILGSMVRSIEGYEIWVKPLHNGDFAAVLFNKSPIEQELTMYIRDGYGTFGGLNGGDFYPAVFHSARVRDVHSREDLGVVDGELTLRVAAHDSRIVRLTPIINHDGVVEVVM